MHFYFKDSIEANVESAEVHVQQANQQLARAADHQVTFTAIHFLTTWSFDLKGLPMLTVEFCGRGGSKICQFKIGLGTRILTLTRRDRKP